MDSDAVRTLRRHLLLHNPARDYDLELTPLGVRSEEYSCELEIVYSYPTRVLKGYVLPDFDRKPVKEVRVSYKDTLGNNLKVPSSSPHFVGVLQTLKKVRDITLCLKRF